MFDRGGDLVGKRPRVKLAAVVTSSLVLVMSIPFPVAAFIPSAIRHVQPTAEFVFTVIAPNVWSWVSPSCLYVLLNILILALGVQSGALTASKADARPSTNFMKSEADADAQVEHPPELEMQTHASIVSAGCGNVSKPDHTSASIADLTRDVKEESSNVKEAKPSAGLYCKKSRSALLRRSSTGLSNLSRETSRTHTQLSPHLGSMRESVVFEICAEQGEVENLIEEDDKARPHEGSLSSEELYAKAESFIGNFYRELKMQRENSWKRLCAIYRQSC